MLIYNLKYRKEIDGLRALAVLSIILFHAGFKVFSGGFMGDEDQCKYKHENIVLYKDSNHLTLVGSDFYSANFAEFFKA